MPFYESIFIVRQDVPATQVETLATSFAEILTAKGGKVTKTEQWGLRTLAYRINKNRKGHYVMFNLDAPAVAVAEMERNMGLSEDVLRHLTIRVDELEEGPSAIMRKEERTDRPFGERTFGDRDAGDRPRRPRFEKTESAGAA